MMEWILSCSVLILIVLALRKLLQGKITLRLQYALWGLVLVRLLVPGSFFSSSISVQNWTRESEAVQFVQEVGNIDLPSQSYASAYEQTVMAYEDRGVDVDSVAEEALEYEAMGRMISGVTLKEAALVVWLAGAVGMLAVMVGCNGRFRRKLRRDREVLDVARTSLPVYVSSQVQTPCLVGLFQPAIYVTPEVAADGTRLRHVLEHELTHYRHCDYITAPLRCLALALHWYNPLVWWAAKVSKQDGELACDEGTIARLGEEERTEYGRTLIALTCTKTHASDVMLTATTMTGSRKSIKERIVLIAKQPKMAVYTAIAVILVAALAVGCTFTGAKEESGLAQLTDEELTQALIDGEDSDQITEALVGITDRTVKKDGLVKITQWENDVGQGFGLDSDMIEALKELFSRYEWQRMNDEEGIPYDVVEMELHCDYTNEGKLIQYQMQANAEDEGLLLIRCAVYQEDGATLQNTQSGLLRAEPKEENAPSLYEALGEIFEKYQAGEEEPVVAETSVAAEEDDGDWYEKLSQAEDSQTIVGLLEDWMNEGLRESVSGMWISLVRNGSGSTYYSNAETVENMADLFSQYLWSKMDTVITAEEEESYVRLQRGHYYLSVGLEGKYVTLTWYEYTPGETDGVAQVRSYCVTWDVVPILDTAPSTISEAVYPIYNTVILTNRRESGEFPDVATGGEDSTVNAATGDGGTPDEGVFARMCLAGNVSWGIYAYRIDDAVTLTILTEEQEAAVQTTLDSYNWVRKTEGWTCPEGTRCLTLTSSDLGCIDFYEDSDVVLYTSGVGSWFYTVTPKSEETQSIWDGMLLLYENQ